MPPLFLLRKWKGILTMATKNNPGQFDCYERAGPDEPLFVLRAKDLLSPELVRLWADKSEEAGEFSDKVTEARKCADDMEAWYKENV